MSSRLRYFRRGSVDRESRSCSSARWQWGGQGTGTGTGAEHEWRRFMGTARQPVTQGVGAASATSAAAVLLLLATHHQIGEAVVCEDQPLQAGYRICRQARHSRQGA